MVCFLLDTCLGHTEPRRTCKHSSCHFNVFVPEYVSCRRIDGQWKMPLRLLRLQLDSTLEEIAVLELSRQYSRYNILVREN